VLILLSGPIGSGKTTLRQRPAPLLSLLARPRRAPTIAVVRPLLFERLQADTALVRPHQVSLRPNRRGEAFAELCALVLAGEALGTSRSLDRDQPGVRG
jgi:hypothetical protein